MPNKTTDNNCKNTNNGKDTNNGKNTTEFIFSKPDSYKNIYTSSFVTK